MIVREFHQLVPNLVVGDAISQQVLTLRRLLREVGVRSEIYARNVAPEVAGEARPARNLESEAGDDTRVLYHFSIGSEVTDVFRRLPGERWLLYHNITPPAFFRGVNERIATRCARGRDELASLMRVTDVALGVSEFNRKELEELGFARTGVLPMVVDPRRYQARRVRSLWRQYRRDGAVNWLHVGRLAPNKRIEDLLKTFYFFRRKIRPDSRLLLVGIDTDMELYGFALRELALDLGIEGVEFVGGVTPRELVNFYRMADLYVCMSEHEGFCVPLVEAMHFGVPVMAYAAAAVPETLGNAGILLREKRHPEVAELAGLILEDGALRERLVRRGRERAAAFLPERIVPELRRLLESP